jgi:hypothetical protein
MHLASLYIIIYVGFFTVRMCRGAGLYQTDHSYPNPARLGIITRFIARMGELDAWSS